MEISDSDILRKIAEQDVAAFDLFYNRYRRSFHNWVYVHTMNPEMTEDIMQNFWVDVWIRPLYFRTDEQGCVKRFMLQNLTYRIFDHLKSAANRRLGNESLFAEARDTVAYSHVFEELEGNEIYTLVEKVLDELPQIARDIFNLRVKQQYTVGKTASRLNISEKTVRERYNWTLTILRHRLSELYPGENSGFYLYLFLMLLDATE